MSGGIVRATQASLPTLTDQQTSLPSLDTQGRARVVTENAGLPVGAAYQAASSSGANASVSAVLANAAGKTTFLSGFAITGLGATAAAAVVAAITGIAVSGLSFDIAVPAGVLVGITPLIITFPQPIPASGLNTAITVNVPAFGAGNTSVHVNAWGFQI